MFYDFDAVNFSTKQWCHFTYIVSSNGYFGTNHFLIKTQIVILPKCYSQLTDLLLPTIGENISQPRTTNYVCIYSVSMYDYSIRDMTYAGIHTHTHTQGCTVNSALRSCPEPCAAVKSPLLQRTELWRWLGSSQLWPTTPALWGLWSDLIWEHAEKMAPGQKLNLPAELVWHRLKGIIHPICSCTDCFSTSVNFSWFIISF